MFCIKCGTELPEEAAFCRKCGQRIGVSVSPKGESEYEYCVLVCKWEGQAEEITFFQAICGNSVYKAMTEGGRTVAISRKVKDDEDYAEQMFAASAVGLFRMDSVAQANLRDKFVSQLTLHGWEVFPPDQNSVEKLRRPKKP
jgi:hypothetical protein